MVAAVAAAHGGAEGVAQLFQEVIQQAFVAEHLNLGAIGDELAVDDLKLELPIGTAFVGPEILAVRSEPSVGSREASDGAESGRPGSLDRALERGCARASR